MKEESKTEEDEENSNIIPQFSELKLDLSHQEQMNVQIAKIEFIVLDNVLYLGLLNSFRMFYLYKMLSSNVLVRVNSLLPN